MIDYIYNILYFTILYYIILYLLYYIILYYIILFIYSILYAYIYIYIRFFAIQSTTLRQERLEGVRCVRLSGVFDWIEKVLPEIRGQEISLFLGGVVG